MKAVRTIRKYLPWVALAAAAGAVAYQVKLKPVSVSAHVVDRRDVTAEVMGTGTLEARVKAAVSSKIQGRVAEVLVDQNDSVKAGQLLARLDDEELRQQVELGAAELSAARARVTTAKAETTRAEASMALAEAELGRAADLRKAQISAQSEMDKATEKQAVASADLNRAQAGVIEAERRVVAAEKTLHFHEARLADTRLTAPFDALVVRRVRESGDVVVPGSAVFDVAATAELWISAWVDETAITAVAPGLPARVVFRSEPAREYPGEVARVGRQVDRETREFIVDVTVKELPARWAIGQRAEVRMQTQARSGVLAVPVEFIVPRTGRTGVMVDVGGRAEWRAISPGARGREWFEVLDGVAEGTRVITAKKPIEDGQRVTRP